MIAALLGQEQDKQGAIEAMQELLSRHPGSADAQFAYAHLLLRAGEPGRQEQARHGAGDRGGADHFRPPWRPAPKLGSSRILAPSATWAGSALASARSDASKSPAR